MLFFSERKERNPATLLEVGMELPRVYYLMGSPDERVEEKDGFTLIWKRTELLRISERVSVRFRDRRVVSWNIAE